MENKSNLYLIYVARSAVLWILEVAQKGLIAWEANYFSIAIWKKIFLKTLSTHDHI